MKSNFGWPLSLRIEITVYQFNKGLSDLNLQKEKKRKKERKEKHSGQKNLSVLDDQKMIEDNQTFRHGCPQGNSAYLPATGKFTLNMSFHCQFHIRAGQPLKHSGILYYNISLKLTHGCQLLILLIQPTLIYNISHRFYSPFIFINCLSPPPSFCRQNIPPPPNTHTHTFVKP